MTSLSGGSQPLTHTHCLHINTISFHNNGILLIHYSTSQNVNCFNITTEVKGQCIGWMVLTKFWRWGLSVETCFSAEALVETGEVEELEEEEEEGKSTEVVGRVFPL